MDFLLVLVWSILIKDRILAGLLCAYKSSLTAVSNGCSLAGQSHPITCVLGRVEIFYPEYVTNLTNSIRYLG